MVRVVCLESDDPDDDSVDNLGLLSPVSLSHIKDYDGTTLNLEHGFTKALVCYPFISRLGTLLDLTALHNLALTCRQLRANLLQHRKLLIASSLHCENEDESPALRLGKALNQSYRAFVSIGVLDCLPSGRISKCARDLVDECRRCGKVVCRNCIMKPPARPVLEGRYRRLCRTCIKSPIDKMTVDVRTDDCSDDYFDKDFVSSIARTPCTCYDSVWICSPCGQTLRAADVTYMRGWTWRTRYSTCGGFGTGLGEGVEGVECGRGTACLDTRNVEQEVECDARELAAIEAETERARLAGHVWAGNSYTTQEMVGIGGQVKIKVKKLVDVGAVVREYEDERSDGEYLARERKGQYRSWCSWCDRVVPSETDMKSSLQRET